MNEIQLPSHWKVVKLNDISQGIQSGGTPYRKKSEFYGGSISWIKTLDLNENIVTDSEEKITEAGFESIRGKIRPINTVMVAMYGGKGTVGKSGILGIPATTNQAVCCIEPNPNNFDSFYLLYYLIYFRPIWMRYAIGTRKDPNISKGIIEKTEIPLPPLPEQKTIAHTLRTIQKAKETRQRELELERERKAALMQYLFTHGTRNEPRKQTEIGEMPESWNVVQLKKVISQAQYGLSVKGSLAGSYAILRMNCLSNGCVTNDNLQYVSLDSETFTKFRLNKGDLLFNRTNSDYLVGKIGLFDLDGDFVFASYLIRIAVNTDEILPLYLNAYLNLEITQRRLRSLASRGVSQANINATKLSNFPIPVAPLPEQYVIASAWQSCDRKIQALEKEIALTDELFHAMLEQLMTGKISTQPLSETYV